MNELEAAQAAWPVVEKIARTVGRGEPYRKLDPRDASRTLPGWYVRSVGADGNEVEIHVNATGRSVT